MTIPIVRKRIILLISFFILFPFLYSLFCSIKNYNHILNEKKKEVYNYHFQCILHLLINYTGWSIQFNGRFMFDDLRKTWLFSLLGRLTAFLALLSLLILFLYIIGNYQQFLDSSQLLLLKILETVSLFGAISGIYYIFFIFFIGLMEKKVMVLRLVLTILIILVCVFLFSGIKFLSSWFTFSG